MKLTYSESECDICGATGKCIGTELPSDWHILQLWKKYAVNDNRPNEKACNFLSEYDVCNSCYSRDSARSAPELAERRKSIFQKMFNQVFGTPKGGE